MAEKEKEVNNDQDDRNPNHVRDLIFTALSITEYTQIPMLFLGNPGIAKTTGVRLWAETYGYRVTTLIGTQRVAEEILGYMVNDTGEKRLITYTPDWFDEVVENKKAGFKTLLFIDELSQAPDNVQGAMLQLIFDRRVGGRANYLPDDCLVVSAANYKGNIPPQCGIQAPTLNRFCIVNVNPIDGIGLITEFLQSEEERKDKIPVFGRVEISPRIEDTARKVLKDTLAILFSTYCRKDDKEMTLDVNNTNFSDIFDQPGPIHNFITGRTVHYMYKLVIGFIHLRLIRKIHKEIIANLVLGLGGLGTNTFKNEKQKEDFQTSLLTGFQKILRRSVESNMEEINSVELDFTDKTIEEGISMWMRSQESNGNINDINLQRLMELIRKNYGSSETKMTATLTKNWDSKRVLGDLQKLNTLAGYLKSAQMMEIGPLVKELEVIAASWDTYKTAILNSI